MTGWVDTFMHIVEIILIVNLTAFVWWHQPPKGDK